MQANDKTFVIVEAYNNEEQKVDTAQFHVYRPDGESDERFAERVQTAVDEAKRRLKLKHALRFQVVLGGFTEYKGRAYSSLSEVRLG